MTMQKAFKKYAKSRQTMLAYHGGTCNQHDFEAGYKAAIADIADDSALDAALKAERKRCLDVCTYYEDRDAIRSLK